MVSCCRLCCQNYICAVALAIADGKEYVIRNFYKRQEKLSKNALLEISTKGRKNCQRIRY